MKNKTVLIVDDEVHITHMLALRFQEAGASVLTAHEGEEAYDLACLHRPDLVIADFQMPLMDGLELCIKLREDDRTAHVPVLMLTARGHKLYSQQFTRTNIRELMGKPFSMRELLATAAALMDPAPLPPRRALGGEQEAKVA